VTPTCSAERGDPQVRPELRDRRYDGDHTFTINNTSSPDSPNLILATLSDNILGDLMDEARQLHRSPRDPCTFTATYLVPAMEFPATITNTVSVLYHPAGFPNNIADTDTHTLTLAPKNDLTNTEFCPLPNNQFRLNFAQEDTGYRLNASNPGQFYDNAFYVGTPGETVTMSIAVAYPFITQGANPIQIHDNVTLVGGCYVPSPSLTGYTITTEAASPTSASGHRSSGSRTTPIRM
jgi:hypothetical protein